MVKVTKFGGSSVAGPGQFKKVKDIITSDPLRKVVVISASGKRSSDDHKMTDLLYLCHAHLQYGVSSDTIVQELRSRFEEIITELGLKDDVLNDFDSYCAKLSKDTSRDELVSRGEYFTSRLMAEYLGYTFIDAAKVVFFSFDGSLDTEKTYSAIREAYEQYGTIVLPGFYGSLPGGRVKVMARGGSDITGSLAAAALNADVYENWTDVSGVLMADPKIVDNPKPISMMTYAELRELAFLGASVLQEESVQPVREAGIPLNIRNTNRPQDFGTLIVEKVDEENMYHDRFITGIAGRKNFTSLTVVKHNMSVPEVLKDVLEIFVKYHASVEHITLGLDSFSLVTSAAMGDAIFEAIADIQKTVQPDDISTQEGLALIAAVGRKMTFRPGISGRLFNALGEKGVNIRTIAQGSDELSIIVGVDNKDFDTTVRVLYEGFAG